jgi:hypothetical protein
MYACIRGLGKSEFAWVECAGDGEGGGGQEGIATLSLLVANEAGKFIRRGAALTSFKSWLKWSLTRLRILSFSIPPVAGTTTP